MAASEAQVLPHNDAPARMWGLGGAGYDKVSFFISDALAHATQRLASKEGEQVLDIATGTGWVARSVASFGAKVTAVDISPGLLDAARELSAHAQPSIDFQLADAEKLPFPDAGFDRVISTFGLMFAQDHEAAARELLRVTRPGGRIVLTTWMPESSVADMFGIIGKYRDRPAPSPSPLAWGEPGYVRERFGKDADLLFETGVSESFYDSPDDIWQGMRNGFGPIRELLETLDEDRANALRQEIDALHSRYTTEDGLLRIPREYLLTIATRR